MDLTDECTLVGTDNKEGTIPMYIVPFKTQLAGYVLSSTLFLVLLLALYYFVRIKTNYSVSDFINKNRTQIIIMNSIILVGSFILFCVGNESRPIELFFGILGIMLTISIYTFAMWNYGLKQ